MCAYCERPVALAKLRIEHVHPQNADPCSARPSGHYLWANLLGVCGDQLTCDGPNAKAGNHRCGIFLFPDELSADEEVVVVNVANGELLPSPNLAADRFERVMATLVGLGLNTPELRGMRHQILRHIDSARLDGVTDEEIGYDLVGRGFATVVDSQLRLL